MILFVCAFVMQLAHAVPEKTFSKNWHSDVAPYFAQGFKGTFVNSQGMKLNYHAFVSSTNKKTLVILPGRTEPALKYAEVIFDLRDLGCNIFILDHQGQGGSERLLKDTQKGHVRFFSDYVKDFTAWMNEVVIPESKDQERFILAHSMGGTVATHYLARHHDVFNKAVLSSPMMEVNTKPYQEDVALALTSALILAFQGTKYAPDRGPYIPEEDTFEKNEVTHSRARFDMAKAIFLAWPEYVVGGPTNKWVNQSLIATRTIDSLAAKIHTPILMFQSGMDLIVKLPRQDAFCRKSANCKKVHFATAHHEILQETDDLRNKAMSELKDFLKP